MNEILEIPATLRDRYELGQDPVLDGVPWWKGAELGGLTRIRTGRDSSWRISVSWGKNRVKVEQFTAEYVTPHDESDWNLQPPSAHYGVGDLGNGQAVWQIYLIKKLHWGDHYTVPGSLDAEKEELRHWVKHIEDNYPRGVPEPVCGQVWAWIEEGEVMAERTVTAIEPTRRGYDVFFGQQATVSSDNWPPIGTILVAGHGAPWVSPISYNEEE